MRHCVCLLRVQGTYSRHERAPLRSADVEDEARLEVVTSRGVFAAQEDAEDSRESSVTHGEHGRGADFTRGVHFTFFHPPE